jgi:hypothetical protein
MSNQPLAAAARNKEMASEFLAGLDPNASKFTFQFFSDSGNRYADVFHGTLDEVWPKVQAFNTPQSGIGVFVTINETDLKGRRTENIVRARALFVDADSEEQGVRCVETFKACGVKPSIAVKSGRGVHFYFFVDDIPREKFSDIQKSLIDKVGTDPTVKDLPRVMRLPGTLHLKDPTKPRLVKLYPINPPVRRWRLSELITKLGLSSAAAASIPAQRNNTNATAEKNDFAHQLDWEPIVMGCPFFFDTLKNGGHNHSQGLWNLTILAATFLKDGEKLAHKFGNKHSGYKRESTKAMWERKVHEKAQKGLGWPSCDAIQNEGCKLCATCNHFGTIKSPLNLAKLHQPQPAGPSFVDPYAEFVGPKFPLDVLPPTLAKFVEAEHRAMGADPSAIAMAALTTVAGAVHGETRVRAGEGWSERPILWTALLGQPSTMKSPIITKATKPLSHIDRERQKRWQQEYAIWQNQK